MQQRSIFLALFVLLQSATGLHAQLPDLPIIPDSLYSQVLKEGRRLEIVLPDNYKPADSGKYDVLYITDGEWNTRIVSNIRQFLNIQFIPENIIVSIPNVYPNGANQRGRDFTPTHSAGMPESGGAEKFLSFIKTELIPYINKKYKTNGENTLYGSSLGGIFAMYTFCKEPELFQSYLIADPAWWWDNSFISTLVKANLDKLASMDKTLLITGREGAPYQYMGIAKVDTILAAAKAKGAHWKTMLYNDETHNAMIFRTIYDGLKYTYAGFGKEALVFHPMNGILLSGKPVTVRSHTDLLNNLHYTTDGTAPDASSPKITGDTLQVTGPSKLVVTSISNRERYNTSSSGIFTERPAALQPVPKKKNSIPGGWKYEYYEGTWDSLPDFKKMKALKTGITDTSFSITKLPKQEHFACRFTGQLEIKTDGYYLFGIDASGGARLSLANQLLIDYNGIHQSGNFQSFVVPLVKGFYPVAIEYFQQKGKPGFELMYITPENSNAINIPLGVQYALRN
ncbi:MAG: alpha/beta hydrolase-fold protein [Chitinophagaceae bacterium]